MILIIDNYDSFTYNLVQLLGELGADVKVVRNDEVTIPDIEQLDPAGIIISPGPCTPAEAGISVPVIQHFHQRTPIFGVCLGHQSIGAAFGGNVIRAHEIVHGKTADILHDGTSLFQGIPSPFKAARYHSLIIEKSTLPKELRETASTSDGLIMAVQHIQFPTFGVQFHPESIATEHGRTILANFLSLT